MASGLLAQELTPSITGDGVESIVLGSHEDRVYHYARPGDTVVLGNQWESAHPPYQWFRDGQVLSATNPERLELAGITASHVGYYTLRDGRGRESAPYPLSVFTPPDIPVDKTFVSNLTRPDIRGVADDGTIIVQDRLDNGADITRRLLPDGTEDTQFSFPDSAGSVLLVLPDGGLITSGAPHRLHADGTPDPLPLPEGFDLTEPLRTAIRQPNGSLILTQSVSLIDPDTSALAAHWLMGRLLPDGSNDDQFDSGPARLGSVYKIIASRDQTLLVTHSEARIDGNAGYQSRHYIDRFLPTGELDPAQTRIGGSLFTQLRLHELPDGQLLVGESTHNGGLSYGLRNANGTQSASNNRAHLSYIDNLHTILPDGSLLYVHRGTVQPEEPSVIRRLKPYTLEPDPDYHYGHGTGVDQPWVEDLHVLPNGDLLVGGIFTHWAGHATTGLVRITADPVPEVAELPFPFIGIERNGQVGSPYDKLHHDDRVVLQARPRPAEDITYEWLSLDGHTLPSSPFTPQLVHDPVELSHLGTTGLKVTSAQGTFLAEPVTLRTSPGSHLANLSSRATVGTGEAAPIIGMTLPFGSVDFSSRLLFRGVGPGLAHFDIDQFLPDPRLAWFDTQGNEMAANDNWTPSDDLQTTIERVGAFTLDSNSRDAVLLLDFDRTQQGTLRLTDVSGDESDGIALFEAYDAGGNHSSFADRTPPRLSNLSLRGLAGQGEQTLIGGFVIRDPHGFDRSITLLLRAIGPSLAQHGIAQPVTDPGLTLYDAEGQIVATNDDWGLANNPAALAASMQQVGAFALDPDSRDAALLLSLPPGAYTAHIANPDETDSAIALFELYLLP